MRVLDLARRSLSTSTDMLPVILGTCAFFLVAGPRILDPTNIAWLADGDPASHFLGWHFFRNSPWSFPVGLNPDYGLELSSAIVYTDSIPLLAIPFKSLSGLLPDTFQYTGFWLFACFVLQAWFGWKLASLISNDVPERFFAAGLFVFAPPMIWRLHGHFSLVAHFLILWALYLSLRPARQKDGFEWGLLLSVTALVHFYIFAMVSLLWLASLLTRLHSKTLQARFVAIELLGVASVVAFVSWLAGYFSVSGAVSAGGFGFYRMDLLSLLNSRGWSYILKALPKSGGDYEGFNYLGLGVITLWVLAIPIVLKDRRLFLGSIRRHKVLLLALLALALISVSNKIGLASVTVLDVPLSEALQSVAGILRSSGRMFWPVFYALLFAIIAIIVRGYGRQAGILLAIALVAQTADTSAVWLKIRMNLMADASTRWASPLKSRFWSKAATQYKSVRSIMPGNILPRWRTISSYAGQHGMSTDIVYLARVGAVSLKAAKSAAANALTTGNYDHNTLYILDAPSALKAMQNHDSTSDLLAQIDGFNVLAPDWIKCRECPQIHKSLDVTDLFNPIEIGKRLDFSSKGSGEPYLDSGWSRPEGWGVWSNAAASGLVLPILTLPDTLLLEMSAFVTPLHPLQRVEVSVNGVNAGQFELSNYGGNRLTVTVPSSAYASIGQLGYLAVDFRLPDAVRPREIGHNSDSRRLAIGLEGITLFKDDDR